VFGLAWMGGLTQVAFAGHAVVLHLVDVADFRSIGAPVDGDAGPISVRDNQMGEIVACLPVVALVFIRVAWDALAWLQDPSAPVDRMRAIGESLQAQAKRLDDLEDLLRDCPLSKSAGH
jgi:hypothetical protein